MKAVKLALEEGSDGAAPCPPAATPPELSRLPRSSRMEARARALAARHLPDGRSWLDVLIAAARVAGATLEDALSGATSRAAAHARHLAWHELRRCAGYSYREISRVWRVDKGTIAEGVKAIAAQVAASRSVP
jgi:hypothetical protein